MKKCRLFSVFVTLIFCSLFFQTQAVTGLLGGEITYTKVAQRYYIKLVLYADCNTVMSKWATVNAVKPFNLPGVYELDLKLDTATITANMEVCPADSMNLDCNGGTYRGYKRYEYTTDTVLPSVQTWHSYNFTYTSCCRDSANNIHSTNNNTYLNLDTYSNQNYGYSSSPYFLTPAVVVVQSGKTQLLNWSAMDDDGDDLRYSLIDPNDAYLIHTNGYTAQQPLNSFAPTLFDSTTGILTISPLGPQRCVITMDVSEYRAGTNYPKGRVRRDMHLIVIPGGSDSVPTVSGFNGTNVYETSLILGDTVDWTFNTYDADAGQQLTVTCDSVLLKRGATITTTGGANPSVNIHWNPQVGVVKAIPTFFSITARDNFCPFNSVQTYTYKVNVADPRSLNVYYNYNNDTFTEGDYFNFLWTHTGNIQKVKIELYDTVTGVWTIVTDSVANTHQYGWPIPNMAGFKGFFRVSDIYDSTVVAYSSGIFSIVPWALSADITITDVTCYGQSTGRIHMLGKGGLSGTYRYSIDSGQTFQLSNYFLNRPAGTYNVAIKDTLGVVYYTATISQPPPLLFTTTLVSDGAYPDTVTSVVSGGVPPYTYSTPTSGWTTSPVITQPGIYFYVVRDSNTCANVDTIVTACNNLCVWPGDTDYDGVVSNNDLLPISLGYAKGGKYRYFNGIEWKEHYAEDWVDTLLTGINYKHIDCDGDAYITAMDTQAISQNYGLMHPRSGGLSEPRSGVPVLQVKLSTDTLIDGETVTARLILGDSLTPANNVYALAFTFNYDATLVDSNEVSLGFEDSTWLCNTVYDHMSIIKKFKGSGAIETAVGRIKHVARSGFGEIASVSMKIKADTTGGITGYQKLLCYISDMTVIDALGNHLQVDMGYDSTTVEFAEPVDTTITIGIAQISLNNGVSIYPNPATNVLNIRSKQHNVEQFTITSLLGEVMVSGKPQNGNNVTVNTSQLAQGVYIIRVQSGNNGFVGRFTKQ